MKKVALLLYGQMRTFEKIWQENKALLDQYFDYDVYIVSSNRNSIRGRNSFELKSDDDIRNIFSRFFGDKLKYIKVVQDISMREKGTWDEYCRTHNLFLMFGDGVEAFDPADYGLDPSKKLTDEEFRKRNELIALLKSYNNGTVISVFEHQYLFHEPLLGTELQSHKREILYKETSQNWPQYEFLILTRPDFRFDPDVIEKIAKIEQYGPKEIYTYPNDFYPMSDLFMVGHYEPIGCLCQFHQWTREYDYRHLQELYDLLMKQWPYNEQHNWGSPVGIENTTAYHLVRNGIELKYLSSNNTPRYTNIVR